MSTNNPISIPAHFDGERILLDEPVELERDARLLVTVIPNGEIERETWVRFSAGQLSKAYDGDDEYPLEAIKEMNPDYEGR
jgi:hypothetical protein